MARYTKQTGEILPYAGANIISHRVEILEAATFPALQIEINVFLEGLKAVAEFPIIKSIEYTPGTPNDSALIHYLLVS